MSYSTLIDVLENNRSVDRAVTFVEGESAERRVPFKDVYTRALGILHHLQAMGAQRGDPMIIFLNNNEQFMDGFWAAVCGGIVPVPLAVGISDEQISVETSLPQMSFAARSSSSATNQGCTPTTP